MNSEATARRRGTGLAAICLLALSASWCGAQEARPRLDIQMPPYAVDAAACKALMKGGTNTFTVDPYKINGVTPEKGIQISGALVPASPVFLFYANHLKTLYFRQVSFDPSMRCFVTGTLGQDGLLHFEHLPNGEYIPLITVSYNVTYQGVTSNVSTGIDSFGMPVTMTSHTPTTGQYVHERVYGSRVTLKDGTISGTNPIELTGGGK